MSQAVSGRSSPENSDVEAPEQHQTGSGPKGSTRQARKAGRGGRKPETLRGTNLHRTETGLYIWRAPDDGTGYRPKRSTEVYNLEQAKKIAEQYLRDHMAIKKGLEPSKQDGWSKLLKPLVEDFITFEREEGKLSETTAETKKFRILRALDTLNLRTAANLDHVAAIDKRLKDHGKTQVPPLDRDHLRRAYQEPLKQFSAWLAVNKRHLDRDPLVAWAPIRTPRSEKEDKKTYRAFTAEEVARALLASERLDAFHERPVRLGPLFLALLITGSRPGALLERDVEHFLVKEGRIDLGLSRGKKRRGEAALDPATLEGLRAYLGGRKEESLFLGPQLSRVNINKLLDYWREAFGLGLVDALWPADEPRSLRVAYLVSLFLTTGRLAVSNGGDPRHIKPETLAARQELEARVRRIAEGMREEWKRRMENVAAYGLRTTHRTWAEIKGVPGAVIDKQLGHGKRNEALIGPLQRLLEGSATGRNHYLDPTLFDASRSAKAVREMLEEGMKALEGVETILRPESVIAPDDTDGNEAECDEEDESDAA